MKVVELEQNAQLSESQLRKRLEKLDDSNVLTIDQFLIINSLLYREHFALVEYILNHINTDRPEVIKPPPDEVTSELTIIGFCKGILMMLEFGSYGNPDVLSAILLSQKISSKEEVHSVKSKEGHRVSVHNYYHEAIYLERKLSELIWVEYNDSTSSFVLKIFIAADDQITCFYTPAYSRNTQPLIPGGEELNFYRPEEDIHHGTIRIISAKTINGRLTLNLHIHGENRVFSAPLILPAHIITETDREAYLNELQGAEADVLLGLQVGEPIIQDKFVSAAPNT